ncbi:arsenate reductase/protein-tyrosine-phosphatase family protein [Sinomonas terrae]|uniref:arsenate reductase/protein-tyrosine-phosphatase family protein n=1 Tax=Sinomonas terrae TaxID=2908838 RepID=UPI0035575AE7
MDQARFTVLMICSGNLCRSPIAEQLLRTRTIGYPLRVCSAGVIAEEGAAMPKEAAAVSRMYGGEPDGHRAQLLTEGHLRSADLVLTAARSHRRSVVQILPSMSRRTFTINEFARLIAAVPLSELSRPSDPARLVEAARALRGFVPPPENEYDDDLEDPYRQPFEVYEMVGSRIQQQIGVIAERLWPWRAPR